MAKDISNKMLAILAIFVLFLSIITTWFMVSHDASTLFKKPFTATGDVTVTVINPVDYYRAYREQQGLVFDPPPVPVPPRPARNRITGAVIQNLSKGLNNKWKEVVPW